MLHDIVNFDQTQEARETLEKLLAILQSAPVERDRFVSHLYPEGYRRACETAGKSGKQIERCVISTFQIAESLGFKGEQHSQAYTLPIATNITILCSRKQGQHPPLTRSRRPVATNTTPLFSPACRTHSGPKPAVKSAKLAEPSADAIYNAYPNQGPGFYRYVERNQAVAVITISAVPAGSRQTETFGSRKQPLIHGSARKHHSA